MNFGEALGLIRTGKKLRRKRWDNTKFYVFAVCNAVYPKLDKSNDSKLSGIMASFIVIHTTYSYDVPWTPSQIDMFADDWEEVI